jgi:hypothetical protein
MRPHDPRGSKRDFWFPTTPHLAVHSPDQDVAASLVVRVPSSPPGSGPGEESAELWCDDLAFTSSGDVADIAGSAWSSPGNSILRAWGSTCLRAATPGMRCRPLAATEQEDVSPHRAKAIQRSGHLGEKPIIWLADDDRRDGDDQRRGVDGDRAHQRDLR